LRDEGGVYPNFREKMAEIEPLRDISNTYGRCMQDSLNAKRM
jgi:hypothetical protein